MAKVTGERRGGAGGMVRALVDGRGRILIGLGAAGLLLVLVSGMFGTAQTPPKTPPARTPGHAAGATAAASAAQAAARDASDPVLAYEALLDRAIARVLDQVAGAGPVSVAVTVSRSPSTMLVHNLSSSRERQGSTLSQSLDEALAYGRDDVPVTTGEEAAPVVGALVVAPGAADATVRAELTEAVETLLGLAANQVIVLPGRREGS